MPQATKPTWTNILKDVRALIASGHHKYICFAIVQAVYAARYNCYGAHAEALVKEYQRRVTRQLDSGSIYVTYEDWIRRKYPKLFYKMYTSDGFKQGRLLWIDDMIRRANGK